MPYGQMQMGYGTLQPPRPPTPPNLVGWGSGVVGPRPRGPGVDLTAHLPAGTQYPLPDFSAYGAPPPHPGPTVVTLLDAGQRGGGPRSGGPPPLELPFPGAHFGGGRGYWNRGRGPSGGGTHGHAGASCWQCCSQGFDSSVIVHSCNGLA